MPEKLVNVFLENPQETVEGWEDQKEKWSRLNADIGGNPGFHPLTVKAFYVFGIQLAIFTSVSYLLQDDKIQSITYLPAYSLFASGIEILGRCLRGNAVPFGSTKDLKAGFRWLAFPVYTEYASVPSSQKIVSTINGEYSIDQLITLRNYATHAQATTPGEPPTIDFLILQEMPPKIASSLEIYWSDLQREPDPCNALAKANISPIRHRPIFETLWGFSRKKDHQYLAISEVFGNLDWSYKSFPIKCSQSG